MEGEQSYRYLPLFSLSSFEPLKPLSFYLAFARHFTGGVSLTVLMGRSIEKSCKTVLCNRAGDRHKAAGTSSFIHMHTHIDTPTNTHRDTHYLEYHHCQV